MVQQLRLCAPIAGWGGVGAGLIPEGFPCGSGGKVSARNEGDLGSIPGLGRSPGDEKCYLLQYSSLENSMDCIVHRVAKSQTQLSDFHFHFPNSGIKPTSPVSPKLQTDSLPTEPPGKPVFSL